MEADFYSRVHGFYKENRQGLFSYALSLTRSRAAAEDAVQAAILRLLRRGRLPEHPRPYVFRCVRNAAMDGLRRQRRADDPVLDPAGACNGQDPAAVRLIEQCLSRLSARERETVVLRAFDGLTFREIAAVRRRTVGTVASWYRRGLHKMRKMLEEER